MEWQIDDLLQKMVQRGASDLLVKAGSHPGFRIDGLFKVSGDLDVVTPDISKKLATQMLNEKQWERFMKELDLEFSYAVKDLGRFRVNILTQRNTLAIAVRHIPDQLPTLSSCGLPGICADIALKQRGLVLVTGPTSSGKSTTIAAMLNHINTNREGHILTIEDPIEFIHPDKSCFVTQRQLGKDCRSISDAIRKSRRQTPDVIYVGEMRELDTIVLALATAEEGHLVFGTLPTTNAETTISRIVDVFQAETQTQVRVQLASTLCAVISQNLARKITGGRVAAFEILTATENVRKHIREGNFDKLSNEIKTGMRDGMMSLENQLIQLVNRGVIKREDAMAKANRPDEILLHAKGSGSQPSFDSKTENMFADDDDVEDVPSKTEGQDSPRDGASLEDMFSEIAAEAKKTQLKGSPDQSDNEIFVKDNSFVEDDGDEDLFQAPD